jgi:hypothetical protein
MINISMNTYKLFEKLCRQALTEWSTVNHLIKQYPSGKQLMRELHKKYNLPHNLEFREVEKILWRDLSSEIGLAICIGKNRDAAAIYSGSRDSYRAIAVVNGEIKHFDDERGGNVKDWVESHIGKVKRIFVAKETAEHRSKKYNRQKLANIVKHSETISTDKLLKKFSPILRTSIEQVKADVKGMLSSAIKSDAYSKVEKKIEKLKKLEHALAHIENNNFEDRNLKHMLEKAINYAITMSAKHFYPDDTEIEKSYGGQIAAIRYYDRPNGVDKLLNDISLGESKKVSSVLGFFKKGLLVL